MSLYNMVMGVNPATFIFLPMLSKHPNEYPRFRDCFLKDPEHPEYDDHIHIYTRTGGDNRIDYDFANNLMRASDNFVADYDDPSDNTYASWIFRVPKEWKEDFKAIRAGRLADVSDKYVEHAQLVFPKLADELKRMYR